jgi:hypothetical protein
MPAGGTPIGRGPPGRGAKPGRALVQTYQPDHPVMAALLSGDAERFCAEETAVREAAGLPPLPDPNIDQPTGPWLRLVWADGNRTYGGR